MDLFGIKNPNNFHRDPDFWHLKMVKHLTAFYNDCLLPEFIDLRKTRNMAIRYPVYTLLVAISKSKKRKVELKT